MHEIDRVDKADAAALHSLMSHASMRGIVMACVDELEVASFGLPGQWLAHGQPPLPAPAAAPFDMATIASACPSLRCLILSPRSAAGLDLASVASLAGLRSLELRDEHGQLDAAMLSHLVVLSHLTRLHLTISVATAAQALYPRLAQLPSLAHLSVRYGWSDACALSLRQLKVHNLSLLARLRHLTRLELSDQYVEGCSEHLPLPRYLSPFTLCTQLVRLELLYHSFNSVHGIQTLQSALPHLAYLELRSLRLYEPGPPSSAFAPRPLGPTHLKLTVFEGTLPGFLSLSLPPSARVEVHNGDGPPNETLMFDLGIASSADDVAVAAEQLARATAVLHAEDITLSWDEPPAATDHPARVISALAPLSGRLGALALHNWRVDREVVEAVVKATPRVQCLEFSRSNDQQLMLSGQAWQALLGLSDLSCLVVPIGPGQDLSELAALAAAAPKLTDVFVDRHDDRAFKAAIDALEALVNVEREARGFRRLTFMT